MIYLHLASSLFFNSLFDAAMPESKDRDKTKKKKKECKTSEDGLNVALDQRIQKKTDERQEGNS